MWFKPDSTELRAISPAENALEPPVEKFVDIGARDPHKKTYFLTCQFLCALINLESPLFIYQKRSLHQPCSGFSARTPRPGLAMSFPQFPMNS